MSADSNDKWPNKSVVGVFPTVYDDELLYSMVARFSRLSGYTDAASTNLDLFGRAFGHAAPALPSTLDVMAQSLPASLGLTGRDLALRHTVLPYHCAFLTETAAERATRKACADPGKSVRPTRTVERPLARPTNLRFCPECNRAMERAGQDLHWKRVHQLAIVTVCPEHECDLRESGIRPTVGDRLLYPASDEVCRPDLQTVIPADVTIDRQALVELARQARALLQGEYPAGMTRESGRGYAQLFRDLGYFRNDRLNWNTLLPDAQQAIAAIVPALPGLATISRDGMGWFAHAMSSNRPDHTDSVLITAMIARSIKALAPRFWATLDETTGQPLLPVASAA